VARGDKGTDEKLDGGKRGVGKEGGTNSGTQSRRRRKNETKGSRLQRHKKEDLWDRKTAKTATNLRKSLDWKKDKGTKRLKLEITKSRGNRDQLRLGGRKSWRGESSTLKKSDSDQLGKDSKERHQKRSQHRGG